LWDALGHAELFEVATRARWGYRGGIVRMAAAIDGLAYATRDSGLAAAVVNHSILALTTIDHFAEEARAEYLRRLGRGGEIAFFMVGEPQAGAEALKPETTLRMQADGSAILNGTKWYATNAPAASVIVTCAREHETGRLAVVVLDVPARGVETLADLGSAGLVTIAFRDAPLAGRQVLAFGPAADGILSAALLAERVLAAFPRIGELRYLIEAVTARFGRSGGQDQYLRSRIADMRSGLDSLRCLAHGTLERFAQGKDVSLEAALLKTYATRTLSEAAQHALAILGSGATEQDEREDRRSLEPSATLPLATP
jgi:alkylation response protein AidB-like acyl-CoA dehydrogenase